MARVARNAGESVIHHDRMPSTDAVVGHRLILGQEHDLDRMVSNDGDSKPSEDAVQRRDRQTVNENGEEDQPVHNC